MKSDEIKVLSEEWDLDPRIVARIEDVAVVAPSLKEKKELLVEIQWQIAVDKRWGRVLKEEPSWTVEKAFKKIGFKRVKPPKKADWERLQNAGQERIAIALEFEVSVETVEELPNWVTCEAVREDPRLVVNEWLSVAKLSKVQYLSLTNEEIDFMVSVHGYAFPWENWEEAVELIQMFGQEAWERAFYLWRLMGKVPSSLQPWGSGLEAFSDQVKMAVAGTSFLEKLRWKEQDPKSVLETNTDQIDWESFEEVPNFLLERHDVPKNCVIDRETVHLLEQPNAEFCVNVGREGDGSNALMAFHLLEKPYEEWEEEFGQEPKKFLEYWYPWSKKDVPFYDLIVRARLKRPIEESVSRVLSSVYNLWIDSRQLNSPKCFCNFRKLWEDEILDEVCAGIRSAEWETKQGLETALVAFLNGEDFGFPGSHWREVDFVQAFKQAKKLGDRYKGKWQELWLSLLNGNRWVDGDSVFYETIALRDGVWGKYVFEDGTIPDCKCVWGLCEHSQVVLIGGSVKQFDHIAIE